MAIPQSFLQELIARVDVVEIVSRTVQLKKGGANFMGLCPFHSEKSPSFTVSPTKQFYHCFGCGKHGDAIGFLMDQAGMTFIEAVKDLAQQVGMQVPEDERDPQDRARAEQQKQKQATLTEVLEKAGESWRTHLKNSPRAIDYLKSRGLSGQVAKQFGLGYAPDGWRGLASVFAKYDDPLLVESGLVITGQEDGEEDKRYDRFRDRIMFPIRNVKGETIGFGGRVLGDEKPKYLNSPETPVFSKGRELYGLFEARTAIRESGFVLVTEGYMDVVALAQLGFANAVATLGTACTTDHVQKLFRFTDHVVFSFDGDAAGRRAARKALDGALPYANDTRRVKFLFLPAEHDPDSYIRTFGTEAFSRCVQEAVPLSRFLIDTAREGCDLNTAEGRAHLASNAKPLWTLMPDGALKRQLLSEIADLVQLSSKELSELWGASSHLSGSGGKYADRSPSYQKDSVYASAGKTSRPKPATYAVRSGRQPANSRADQAARLLLMHSGLWPDLTSEDHELLCRLSGQHGALFTWLDSQFQEYGPQPWAALREGLRDQPLESHALKLIGQDLSAPDLPTGEVQKELRHVLDLMLVEHLKQQETEAIAQANLDPQALERYRQLQTRRRALEAQTLASAEKKPA